MQRQFHSTVDTASTFVSLAGRFADFTDEI